MRNPSPPTTEEKFSYLRTGRFWLYGISLVSTTPLIFGMLAFTMMSPWLYWYAPFALLISVYLLISLVIGLFGKDFEIGELLRQDEFFSGTVDVFVPTCGEDLSLLHNTFWHVSRIEYAPKTVYVLDDSKRDCVKLLADEFGFKYISRADAPSMKKAGNLRHAFAGTSGEFILILDADFAPRHDILHEMVPYFKNNKLAILQTPQYFSVSPRMNWIEAGAGYVQELFYRLIQVSRNTWGAAICVGSCAMYRRKALEPFGGTALIGYSEDIHTGFNVLKSGWQVKYVPMPLAKGVCPDKLQSFFNQQYRWALGSITLMLNPEFWWSPLTWMQKICFLSGMLYYVATAISVLLTPLPVLVLLYAMPDRIHWFSAAFAIPSFLYGTIALALWTKAPFGFHYFKIRAVQPWAHLFALLDRLVGSVVEWVPTNSTGGPSRFHRYRLVASAFYLTLPTVFYVGALKKIAASQWGFIPSAILFSFHVAIGLSIVFSKEIKGDV